VPALKNLVGSLPDPRNVAYRSIRTRKGLTLDRGLVIFFPGPASFTGEDCAELHLHGGRAVVAAVLGELSGAEGTRHAEAGEFTKRAFLNGKLDLLEAEALGDLIQAETEAQRRFALSNASGQQSAIYQSWRERLLHARAMIEAELDFADEGDVPGSVSDSVWADMEALALDIRKHMSGFHKAEIIREGFRVAIVGAPNAGKSSLLNALARRDVAIVADEPGTTRDLIEVALDLNGYKILVTDTAGIREGAGTVESIGIDRARKAADRSDLILLLEEPGGQSISVEANWEYVRIASKADLGGSMGGSDISISAVTGMGIDALLQMIAERAALTTGSAEVLPVRMRHMELLERTCDCLARAADDGPLELRAEELRKASDDLGRIAGRIDAEELLGAVFSNFCIGK